MASKITFKPKAVTKKILSPLQDRSLDIVKSRFGLGAETERKTLEAIGDKYGITRERVRQIEQAALNLIKKSEDYKTERASWDELKNVIKDLGGLVAEQDLLESISKDEEIQNHVHFYLVLGDEFQKHREDDDYVSRWSVDSELSEKIHSSLNSLYSKLSDDELISESEMVNRFVDELKKINVDATNDEISRRWLCLSKGICKNPLGEWGKSSASGVKARGIKDFAYLMMRKHGSPMHFREVAKSITDTFEKKCHTATCHNELIKDNRFVLVGRGMYALSEWGYKPGVVRDVIREILKREGPLTKEEVVDKVLKERYLKKNTILVNLQNPKYFKKGKDKKYTPV
ncbi:MAG: hypothetical protein KBC17_02835 [Candidatus Pacebacteria bacterium]|nr:hypothetical protein [Candidatus Paceibacterota bacterium]